jgi:2-polyprenyl-3-methyl-5-hydroxy-6-metoxy-1,4-benzoquinol methylase
MTLLSNDKGRRRGRKIVEARLLGRSRQVAPMSRLRKNQVPASGSNGSRSQLDRLEEHFGKTAVNWQDLYTKPWKLNHLVLANRRRVGVEKIREHVAPGTHILDAGCGAGVVALDLARQGFFIHGVDIAESMLELCQKRFDSAGITRDRYVFVRTDVGHANFEPGSFGGIVALGFLEYQDDELAVLHHINRFLEPEGTLVISGPTEIKLANYLGIPAYVRGRLARLGLSKPIVAPTWPGLLHRYSFGRFRGLLEAAGFEVLEYYGHGFIGFEGVGRRLSDRGQFLLHRTFTSLAKFLPIQRWGNDLIVVARKKTDSG